MSPHDEAAVLPYPDGVYWTIAISSVTLIINPYNIARLEMLQLQVKVKVKVKVKQSHYRPGQAQRVPGS